VYKRALHHRQSRGRPLLLTVTQMEFLRMVIEDRFNQKMPVTSSELVREIEWEFGILLLTDTCGISFAGFRDAKRSLECHRKLLA
jgi:transposase